MADENQEPKIIVDEDWKSQVEREKAEAAAKAKQEPASNEEESPESATQQPPAGDASTAGGEATAEGAPETDAAGRELPEASFSSMVTLFFTQAMMALGQFPDPASGKPSVDKAMAKHYIDTMEVLQEKTKGNLSSDEEKMLSEALHAARMTFVSA